MPRCNFVRYYLKPKSWELYGDRPIYELFGIKFYKKYLPTTGDLARKRKNLSQINITNNRINELYKYEKKTVRYEWRHLIGAIVYIILFIIVAGYSYKNFTFFDWSMAIIFNSVLNLGINIYPIFLQRYNRIRIIKILKNNELPTPYC